MREIYNRDIVTRDYISNRKKSSRWLGWLSMCMMFLIGASSFAQVSAYTFAQSSGTYTEISGGTVLATATGPNNFDSTLWSIPNGSIPFTFSFNGLPYTGCSVNSNGYITFGTTLSNSYTSTPISSTTAYNGAISAWGGDLNGGFVSELIASEVRYEAVGEAPNREFVIQFKDWRTSYTASTTNIPFINFQIRLVENSNIIKIIYGATGYKIGSTVVSGTRQIGLRGATNSDFNNRLNATTLLFGSSTAGTGNSSTQAYNTNVATPGMPANGLTYSFTPPVATTAPNCIALPTAPANNAVNIVSNTFTWPAAAGLPNGYRFYLGTDEEATDLINGEDVGAVLTYNAASITLSPGTQYYWRAVAYNDFGDAESCATWSFTSATVPNCATGQSPADSSTDVARNVTLSWTAPSSPSASSYDIYLGTSANPPLIGNLTTTSAIISPILEGNTTYYWKVVPKNVMGDAVGCVEQSFTTGPDIVYCTPSSTGSATYISNFTTTLGSTNISNSTGFTSGGYQNNFAESAVTSFAEGSFNYNFTVVGGTLGAAIWIDWNSNGTFETTERVFVTSSYGSGPYSGTINIPAGTALGDYRMRVMVDYNSSAPSNPCDTGTSSRRETEDYKITVASPPSCLSPTALAFSNATLSSASVSWTSADSDFEWEVRTTGAGGSGATGLVSSGTTAGGITTANATGLTVDTNHTLYVRTNCGVNGYSSWAASAPFYIGYCIPTTTNGCTDGDVIARVTLNTLDNNSGTGCPSGTLGYSNYTTNPALTTTLQAGNSYSCTVYAGQYSEGYAAWIDYNNDGVFDNQTERIGFSNGQVEGSDEEGVLGSFASFPVVISCNPTPGNYRLRVRAMFNTNGIAVTPCAANSYGETEDYMITITAAVACPQPNTLAATAINAQGAILNWNAGCEETLWDVHVGLAGSGSPAGAPSDASVTQSFVKTGLNHSTEYEYWVRANCGSGSVSDWSGPFAFTTTCPTGIWTGTTNTDWNTASNWTDGVVPAACTAVSITAANAVVIPSEVTVASLSIGATANVTVNGILNVGNIAVANGGIFTVANNAVVLQTPTAVNTGVTTVKVNSANLYRQDYTLWSSPVAGQNLRNFSPQTLFNRFSSYDTALGTVGDYVQEIVTTADMNTKTFVNAKGYMIRMPNNWTQFVNASIPGTPYLGQFTGTLNNGNVSIALSQANTKLNLVGNPYPSPISISAFFAANPDINEVLYFWRKRNDAAGSGYATYNAMGLVSVQSDVNGLDMNNTIKPGQGFFVQSNTATTLNFTNAMRTSSQGTFLRGASTTNELHRFWLNLSNTTGVVGQTLIGYATGATLGVDNGLDALYFNDSPLALTSLIDNLEYIIQGRSLPFTDTDIVPLGFKTDLAGSFTISLSNFDGLFADDQAIYLRDNTAGVVHNLKLSEYNFTTGSGIFNTRFEVLYSTTLGTNNPALTHNNILVGVKDQIIQINAGNVTMEKIELIDVSGRVIYTQDGVNATTATLENVVMNNQMLIVRIHTKESGIVTQKIIF